MTGRLEVITGCMFSGKSTELLKRIRLHKLLGRNVLIVTNIRDTRYNRVNVETHYHDSELASVSLLYAAELLTMPELLDSSSVICFDEAQFFNDIVPIVKELVEEYHKWVIVCGLDGSYERKPFKLIDLIPFADEVTRLNALCLKCGDGTLAHFSKRIVANDEELLVGGGDMYMSVCRKHYLENE